MGPWRPHGTPANRGGMLGPPPTTGRSVTPPPPCFSSLTRTWVPCPRPAARSREEQGASTFCLSWCAAGPKYKKWGQNAGRPKPVRVHHAQLARPGSLQLRDKGKGGRPTSYCSVCLSGRGPDKEALQKGGAGCGEERPREAVELLFRLRLQSRAFALGWWCLRSQGPRPVLDDGL